MPIGSTNVYNPGDLILSTVSGSGTSFIETKIAAATSSLILFNSNGTLTSASLNSTTVGTSSYVSGSTSIITSITASAISASGKIQANQLTASSILANNGPLMVTGSNAYIQMFPVGGFPLPTNLTASYIYTSGSTNDLYFTQYNGPYTNTTRLRWIESNLYTGILHGGVLTSTPGSTTFDVSNGEGIIVTMNAFTASAPYPTVKLVYWPTSTQPIINSGSAKITYVGINDAGGIVQQTNAWGSSDINQWDTQIALGVVLHLSGSVSSGVFNSPQISYANPQQADDFFRSFGPLKISGHVLQASGSSPTLSIKKTGGTAYREGVNYLANPNHPSTATENAVNISKIYRYYISGSTPIIDTGVNNAGYTTIDNNYYVDTTTGLLDTVGNSKWTIQRVFWIPNSPTNAFIVYYGNATYTTLLNAVNAKDSEPFNESPNTSLNAIFVGYIMIEGGAGRDLLNADECTIIPGGLFRNVGGIGSSGTAPVSTTLAGLSDVDLVGLAAGDLLVYGGGQWNNNKTLTGNYIVSGSLTVQSGITGNLTGTSSWASNARTASYLTPSNSYTITNLTASTISASGAIIASSFTGSFSGSIGTAVNATSASYALTSSYISPSGNAFVQGGNSFGTTALLGTNDAQPLALETNGTTRMSINSNGNVAINTSTSGLYRLNIADTHLGSLGSSSLYIETTQNQNQGLATSTNDSGITNVYTVNNFTSSTAIQNQAIFNQIIIAGSGSFSGSYRASRNAILFGNTASLDLNGNIINTYLTSQINPNIPTFNINNWTAGTSTYVDLITGNSTGSITNLYQHHIGSPFPSGGAGGITVTNSYGVWINKQKTTNIVTNGWGIYQADTGDLNIFAGKTRIGSTTVPVNALDVTGNISASVVTASLFFGTASFATTAQTANALNTANSYTITNLTASNISASGTGSFGIVGIGTTIPTGSLHIQNSVANIPILNLGGGVSFNNVSDLYVLNSYNTASGVGFAAKVIGVNISGSLTNGNIPVQRTVWSGVTSATAMVLSSDDPGSGNQDNAFQIWTSNDGVAGTELTQKFSLSSTGNVGIGTTLPGEKLTVSGSSYIIGGTGAVGTGTAYYLGDNSNKDISLTRVDAATLAIGRYYPSAWAETIRFTADGNVGIGTSSPGRTLEVSLNATGAAGGYLRLRNPNTTINTETGIEFFNTTSTINTDAGATIRVIRQSALNTSDLTISTTDSSNLTEKLRITSTGNVGIGTTNPTARLHVSGSTGGVFEVDTVGGTTAFYVSASGNVGIGTPNPLGRLHITASATNGESLVYLSKGSGSITQHYINAVNQLGQLNYRVSSDINGHLTHELYYIGTIKVSHSTYWPSFINNDSYTNGGLGIGTTSQTHGYGLIIAKPSTSGSLYVSGSSVFTGSVSIRDNVGIGTTSTSDKLSVVSGSTRIASTALAGALYFGNDTSNIYLQRDNSYDLSLVQNGDSNSALYLASAGSVYVNIDSNNNDTDKAFIVQNNALKAGTELFRIQENGNIGIGTTVPLAITDIQGTNVTIYAANYVGSLGTIYLRGNDAYNSGTAGAGIYLRGKYDSSSNVTTFGAISAIKENDIDGNYAGALTFLSRTNGQGSGAAEKMRIDSNGNVGVGTTSPAARLEISGSSNSALFNIKSPISGNIIFVTGSGCVGINKSTPTATFDISGSTIITGSLNVSTNITCLSLTETSTEAVKYNIIPLPSQLDNVLKLKPVSFNYKTNDKHSIGLIAEEVAKIYPEFTSDTNDSISYGKITSVLIQSIKELKTIIDNQQKQIEDLSNKLK